MSADRDTMERRDGMNLLAFARRQWEGEDKGSATKTVSRWHVQYVTLVEGVHWVTRVQTFTSAEHAQEFAASVVQKDWITCVEVSGPHSHKMPA